MNASLIFSNRYYIRRTALTEGASGEPSTSLLVHNLTNAVALDALWAGGCLLWSDVTRLGSSIKRLCREGGWAGSGEPRVVAGATLQNPDGLAVDWVARNVYWCDKGTDTVEVARLDGRHRRVLLREGLSEPRALALLPAAGWLYWSDWGAQAHIGRAGLDGSRRAVLVAGLGWPNALTLSLATDELFFADARDDYIAVANLDGSNVRILFSRGGCESMTINTVPPLCSVLKLVSRSRRPHAVAAPAPRVRAGRVGGPRVLDRLGDARAGVVPPRARPRLQRACRAKLPTSSTRPPEPTLTALSPQVADAGPPGSGGAYRCRTEAHTVHKPMDLRVLHPARQPPAPRAYCLLSSLTLCDLPKLTSLSSQVSRRYASSSTARGCVC